MAPTLHMAPIDWSIVGAYLLLALVVGVGVKDRAAKDRHSYFLAGRSLPWWWAGLSTAATTFAADTPLAITGIVARRGIAGNWIWLSWVGVHAAVVVVFAACWSRSGALTDAELVSMRYSGKLGGALRRLRAVVYGVVYNVIVLGWVLKAMVKIVAPFFHWRRWTPRAYRALEAVLSGRSGLGRPGEALTIVTLLVLVTTYSSMGGIRGVIATDLLQLAIALVGSGLLAVASVRRAGGLAGMHAALVEKGLAGRLALFPDRPTLATSGSAPLPWPAFLLYLLVQSFANVPADGGGYLMQRLNTTPSARQARGAALLFLLLQYVVRLWPWLLVAVAALVLMPPGAETAVLGPAVAAVANDRELAYPLLMGALLPPALLGLMLASLLAAFMSTIDTHLNWGASYVVNDLYLRLRPGASARRQVSVARWSVVAFSLAAALVSARVDNIEQAWKWISALGAAWCVPTAARWMWWRVNAAAELGAAAAGMVTAAALSSTTVGYEAQLLYVAAASCVGLLVGTALGPANEAATVERFEADVRPPGVWPGRGTGGTTRRGAALALRWSALVAGVITILVGGVRLFFAVEVVFPALWIVLGAALVVWGARSREVDRDRE